jgi:hypothetical protein
VMIRTLRWMTIVRGRVATDRSRPVTASADMTKRDVDGAPGVRVGWSGWAPAMRVDPGVYVTGYDRVGWNLPIHGDACGPYRSRIDAGWHGECCGQLRFVRGGWLSRYVSLMWGDFCARVVVFAFRDPASQESPVGRR